MDSSCKYIRKLWLFSYRVLKCERLFFRRIKLAYLYLKYVTILSKNEPFFLKYCRFTINCMLCRVRTSASVAFIISPSITSLNYSSALISHAKCRILHIHQQNRNTEKDPTVDASNDKKKSYFFSTLPSVTFVKRCGIYVQKPPLCTLSSQKILLSNAFYFISFYLLSV